MAIVSEPLERFGVVQFTDHGFHVVPRRRSGKGHRITAENAVAFADGALSGLSSIRTKGRPVGHSPFRA